MTTPSLTNPNPKREDERLRVINDHSLVGRVVERGDDYITIEVPGVEHVTRTPDAFEVAAPGDPVRAAETEDECIFGDFDEANYKPDLASAIAAEVMGLKWTHSPAVGDDDGDGEQMNRFGDVQEAVGRVLEAARTQTHEVLVGNGPAALQENGAGTGETLTEARLARLEGWAWARFDGERLPDDGNSKRQALNDRVEAAGQRQARAALSVSTPTGEGEALRFDRRAQAAAMADLPVSVAQEAGEFYENAGAGEPIKKSEAMAVAWAEVLRPYLIGLRDHYAEQARPTISDAQLHAAMDAFYPGENWRVDLGCALESSLRDMKSALRAALSVSTQTGEGGAPPPAVDPELEDALFYLGCMEMENNGPQKYTDIVRAALAYPQQGGERDEIRELLEALEEADNPQTSGANHVLPPIDEECACGLCGGKGYLPWFTGGFPTKSRCKGCDGSGKRAVSTIAAATINLAKAIAAGKIGSADPIGSRLPKELLRQALPEARRRIDANLTLTTEPADLSYSGAPIPPNGIEGCVYCGTPFKEGDFVLSEVEGGEAHVTCMGPERDGYVGADGEPLKDGEPIPTGRLWAPTSPSKSSREEA